MSRVERDPQRSNEASRPTEPPPRVGGCLAVTIIVVFLLLVMLLGTMSSFGDIDFDCLGNC